MQSRLGKDTCITVPREAKKLATTPSSQPLGLTLSDRNFLGDSTTILSNLQKKKLDNKRPRKKVHLGKALLNKPNKRS